MNSLARLIRLMTSRSSREHATGGCHTPGRTTPTTHHTGRDTLAPLEAATYPIRIPIRLPRPRPARLAGPPGRRAGGTGRPRPGRRGGADRRGARAATMRGDGADQRDRLRLLADPQRPGAAGGWAAGRPDVDAGVHGAGGVAAGPRPPRSCDRPGVAGDPRRALPAPWRGGRAGLAGVLAADGRQPAGRRPAAGVRGAGAGDVGCRRPVPEAAVRGAAGVGSAHRAVAYRGWPALRP